MTYANVASTTALVLVIGGGGAAVAASLAPANSVGSRQLINNSVKTVDLKNGGVSGADLKDGGVGSADLANGAIAQPGVFGSGNLGVVRAYAWNSSPGAGADLTNSDYTYNRSGGAVSTTRGGVGSYTITFAGLNLSGGNIVVSGYGGTPTWCTVGGWSNSSASVRCFDAAGAPADSYWTISATD